MKCGQNFLLFAAMLFLAACSKAPQPYTHTQSYAIEDYKSTHIGKTIEKKAAQHPAKSGFTIVPYGHEAFTLRIAMTQMPEKSLDLQYYLWEADETGRLLSYNTLKAADRGVRVRVLLDDIGLAGHDPVLAAMDAHPNVEIRIVNPFSERNMHVINFLTDMKRVNHRMHNKTVIMDNTLAIVGGRNVGNHYYGVSEEKNFRDLDMVAVGPVVRDISKMYDYFWNGKWSVPIAALTDKTYTLEDLKKERKNLEDQIRKDSYPYPSEKDGKKLVSQLRSKLNKLVWANGDIVWNDPVQMARDISEQEDTIIIKLHQRLKNVKKSLYIESAYFIPGAKGVARLSDISKRGVKVRVLTNSLKSNDVLAAYSGYEKSRVELLKNGIELYELRADAGEHKIINKTPIKGFKNSGLHTKAMVFDEKDTFVGSFNLDPRSATINTEGGLYVENSALAKRVMQYMNEGIKLENAYRLSLDKDEEIIWTTVKNGKKVVYTSDPEASFWDKLKVGFLQLLPIDEQL